MTSKKSIVITGGIGFIGFALAKALTKKKIQNLYNRHLGQKKNTTKKAQIY